MFPLKDVNPSRTFPLITILIIATNVAVFLYQVSLSRAAQAFVFAYGATPVDITTSVRAGFKNLHPLLTLITSQFLHGGFFHILGNMWFLWIFGDNVEDAMGKIKFLFFYLFCGVAAALTHIYFSPDSNIPMIGASGAIAGVLGSYFLLYPRARVLTLVFLFPFIYDVIALPALIYLGIWFLLQTLYAPFGGAVAWFAHIGGFVCGLLLTIFLVRRRRKGTARVAKRW